MFSNVIFCYLILGSSAIKCYDCTYQSANGVESGTDCKYGGVNSVDCPATKYCAVSIAAVAYACALISTQVQLLFETYFMQTKRIWHDIK